LVFSYEVGEEIRERSAKIAKEVEARFLGIQKSNGHPLPALESPRASERPRLIEAEVEASVVPGPITLPSPFGQTASWWAQLSGGDGSRCISPEAARFVVETVLVRIFGLKRASTLDFEFDEAEPKLRDVHAMIADLCGPQGWETLLKLGGA
jgi:hypothetical protein